MMTDPGLAIIAAARPVIAGVIIGIRKERRAVGHGTSQNIVPVRLVAPAKHAIAVFLMTVGLAAFGLLPIAVAALLGVTALEM